MAAPTLGQAPATGTVNVGVPGTNITATLGAPPSGMLVAFVTATAVVQPGQPGDVVMQSTGWRFIRTDVAGNVRAWLYWKPLAAGAADQSVVVQNQRQVSTDLQLLEYRGMGTAPTLESVVINLQTPNGGFALGPATPWNKGGPRVVLALCANDHSTGTGFFSGAFNGRSVIDIAFTHQAFFADRLVDATAAAGSDSENYGNTNVANSASYGVVFDYGASAGFPRGYW